MLSRVLPRMRILRPRGPLLHSRPSSTTPTTRADRILSKLPPPLQRYAARLRNAPLSHVVAFLVLHEITAVVPLFGLFGLFHYTPYAPTDYVTEHWGGYVSDAARKFERYFRRKEWFGFEVEGDPSSDTEREPGSKEDTRSLMRNWEGAEGKYKVLADVALAWAITKVLLPVRVVASLWATPWFAGVLVRGRRLFTRKP